MLFFLLDKMLSDASARGYCSFIVQHDKSAFQEMENCLSFPVLPVPDLSFTDAFWVFIARNSGLVGWTEFLLFVHFCLKGNLFLVVLLARIS